MTVLEKAMIGVATVGVANLLFVPGPVSGLIAAGALGALLVLFVLRAKEAKR